MFLLPTFHFRNQAASVTFNLRLNDSVETDTFLLYYVVGNTFKITVPILGFTEETHLTDLSVTFLSSIVTIWNWQTSYLEDIFWLSKWKISWKF